MYSDTHFHFNIIDDSARRSVLQTFVSRSTFFAQDIGVLYDDLPLRQDLMQSSIDSLESEAERDTLRHIISFSAGIWPSVEAIKDRVNQVAVLEKNINLALQSDNAFFRRITALGECGLDHHWNASGVDGRAESDFDKQILLGECELFEMQLDLAQKFDLPVVIHSRDAAKDTFNCLKNIGYENGVIHCCTYGIEDVRKFLDYGFYIGFTGSVTYTKKSKMEDMKKLLCYVPEDRILLETDSPYLAPVPFRGQSNTPILIDAVYKFVAEMRSTNAENLSATVDKNCSKLFRLNH